MNENSISRPSKGQLMELAQKLRMQRFTRLYLKAMEEEDFIKEDELTKLYIILKQVSGELDVVRYNRNVRKSGIPSSLLLLNEKPIAAQKNNISLKNLQFIEENVLCGRCRPVLISGPAGSGKTSLGAEIMNRLLHQQLKCRVFDYTRMMQELNSYFNKSLEYDGKLNALSSLNMLMLDDCFMAKCFEYEGNVLRDLLNICAERRCCIMLASQLPVEKWYEHFPDPYTADSIADRLNAGPIKILLTCKSLRKEKGVIFGGKIAQLATTTAEVSNER